MFFNYVDGCQDPAIAAKLFSGIEAAIAASQLIRVLGVHPIAQLKQSEQRLNCVVICPPDFNPIPESRTMAISDLLILAIQNGVGLGLTTPEGCTTAITYGHLWSYHSTGLLQVAPAEFPDDFFPSREQMLFAAPDQFVFPDLERAVMRRMVEKMNGGHPPRCLAFTIPSIPGFYSLTFNVYRDQLTAGDLQLAREWLRWYVPIQIALNLFTSDDPIAVKLEAEGAF